MYKVLSNYENDYQFQRQLREIQINQYLRVGLKYQNFEKFSRIRNEKVLISQSQKFKPNKPEQVLRNSVYTIASNYLWLNDSDWQYFVYYNSFFLHEFQDIPIPQYNLFSKDSKKFFINLR